MGKIRSVAECAIRMWIAEHDIDMDYFTLVMQGDCGILADKSGNSLTIVYDNEERSVYAR